MLDVGTGNCSGIWCSWESVLLTIGIGIIVISIIVYIKGRNQEDYNDT